MKFGKQLKVESVPAWQEHYMSYKRLKRVIKKLVLQAKLTSTPSATGESESQLLIQSGESSNSSNSSTKNAPLNDARKEFFAVLENDIDKVNRFFKEKQLELENSFNSITENSTEFEEIIKTANKKTANQNQAQNQNQPALASSVAALDSPADSAMHPLSSSFSSSSSIVVDLPVSLSVSQSKSLSELCNRLLALYRSVLQLLSFSVLNFEGIRKILKKFDKNMGESHQDRYVARLKTEAFADNGKLTQLCSQVELLFIQLDSLRGIENSVSNSTLKSVYRDVKSPKDDDSHENRYVFVWLALSIVLAAIFYFLPILPDTEIRAHKCLALMAFVTVLWTTEAVPFFVASLAIPLIVIVSGILADPLTGLPLTAEKAARVAFAAMFNDTIMLVLGGFSISAAFSKCQFELQLASAIQKLFGSRPRLFLLAFMFLGAFLSMWISNVAAPVLLTSLLLPIVRDFGSSNQYARALLIGLAFSCNIGGMMSPISSPQNAIALGYLETAQPDQMISFGQWLLVSIPFCSLGVLISWLYLIFVFLRSESSIPEIPSIVFEKTKLTRVHLITIATSVITILLWCSLTYTRPLLGEMGTVAVLPVVLLFGTGVLNKNDLCGFSWHLILLIGGGSVLGSAVNSSRLLQILTDATSPYILGNSLFVTSAAVLTLVFFITTFVSHTVAALILTPVIVSIGVQAGHVQVVLFLATLMMSGTQSLPLSSFPNVNSLLIDDDFNRPFLHAADYLKHGSAVSAALFLLLVTVGYLECLLVFGS